MSKLLDVADFDELTAETALVDAVHAVDGQHPMRRWEYAMALRAIKEWATDYWATHPTATDRDAPRQICDVGGAGSGFWKALKTQTSIPILLADPEARADGDTGEVSIYRGALEGYAAAAPHGQFDVLTCISVIEHLDNPRTLLRAAHMLLRPGGLLFLTTDVWNCEGPDTAHFHWMRKRIYNPGSLKKLVNSLRELGYCSFGQADWAYHGNHVYDYSFASIAVVKRRAA